MKRLIDIIGDNLTVSLNSQLTQQQRKECIMKNGSRKRTHRLGLVGLGLIAISLAALLPIAVSFAQTVSFSPATDFAVWLRPWSVAIGDLNGDRSEERRVGKEC